MSALQSEAKPACCGKQGQPPPANSWTGRACTITSSAYKMAAVTSNALQGSDVWIRPIPAVQGFQCVVSGVSFVDRILSRFPGSRGLTKDPHKADALAFSTLLMRAGTER